MSTRILAISALVLWLVTIAVAGYMFVGGKTTSGVDGRTAIILKEDEKHLVLMEMRTMLTSVHGIVDGLAKEDMNQVRVAAQASGAAIASEVPAPLMAKLPLEFKTLGMGVHRGFDQISAAVEQQETPDMILARLGEQVNSCVACHATYQLQVEAVQQ